MMFPFKLVYIFSRLNYKDYLVSFKENPSEAGRKKYNKKIRIAVI
jgi:hypothetical protein